MSVPPSAQALSAPHRHTGSCEKGHLLLNSKDALICPHDYFVTTNLYSYIVSNIVITRMVPVGVLEVSRGTLCKVYDFLTPKLYT